MEDCEKEIMIQNYPRPTTIEGIKTITYQMEKCICKIYKKDGSKGTGFFCRIHYKNIDIPVLMTNNHVIDENYINSNEKITITLNDDKENRAIKFINNRKYYSNKRYDVTIIEIKQEIDKIDNFMELDEKLFFKDTNYFYNKQSIYIMQYPHNDKDKAVVSFGIISQILDSTINHFCYTESGSSGAPIMNLLNHKIIGIHSGSNHFKINIGSFLKYPIIEFINNPRKINNKKNFINNHINKNNNENENKENNKNENNNNENNNNENNNNENNNNEKNNIENNNEKKEINEDSENKENQEINNIINNNNTESQNKNNNNLDIEIPFIKKTNNLLNELKKLKENGEMKEDDINNEIEELPKRAMIEMSLSDFKIKKQYESIKKELDKKNEYIKKLETEIVNQRILTNNLKKSEGEHLLKISALEDELRVMKSKLLGYNTSEQYNHHIHSHKKFNTDTNNCGHIYGEKLIQSMWVRDNISNNNLNNNYIENNGRPLLNKDEKWEAPWISQPMGNMNRIFRNINNYRNNNYDMGQFKTENRFNNEIREKNSFNNNNERYNNFRLNNNYYDFNGGNSNFQRVSGMILGSPNKVRLTKNFSNDFNRFRIGTNINF